MRPARKQDVFDAVAHPVRRRILVLLKGGARPAGELAEPFSISMPAVSQHLKILREAALVQEEKRGRHVIYHLKPKPLEEVHAWIEEFADFWSQKLDALEAHLDRKYGKK